MAGKGLFVTFEGPEGSGKTTQWKLLVDYLQTATPLLLAVREPGGTSIGDQIRSVLHDRANKEMQPRAEVLLYSASRAQLVGQRILPHLQKGGVVICDRYADSTLAYQGYGRRLPLEPLLAITEFATGGLRPDLIVYLDLDVEKGLERKRRDSLAGLGEWNRMDDQGVDFYRRIRAGYLEMCAADPARWWLLDAAEPVEALHEKIRARVDGLIQRLSSEPGGESK